MKEMKVLKRQYDESEEQEGGGTLSKKCSNFNANTFLKRLRTKDCFEALEEFIKLCKKEKENDPAVMFFKEGGQLMDILNVLDCGQCDDSFQMSKVFAALHCLLLRILSQLPEQKRSAEEMCNRLLSSYLEHINKHLKVNSAAELKKVVLQLLTVVVSLNDTLAKFVLSNVTLTIEDANEIVQMGKPSDRQSVRTCYIQFLMAFLVEGNPYVITLLLQKRSILASILPGLKYDSSQLVVFVLTTLRTKIVECIRISKTVKLHTFNTRVICELADLYEWIGPAGFIKRWQKISAEENMDVEVDKEQLNIVATAAHSLLLVLCTSFRYGILFRDRSLGYGERKNNLVASVLKELKFPWDHKLRSQLVTKIVQACSELARIPYHRASYCIKPRPTDAWIKVITFTTQVISAVDLTDLVNLEPDLALTAVKALVCPFALLDEVAVGIKDQNSCIRYKTVLFLRAVLKASERARPLLPEKEVSLFDSYIKKFLPDGATLENAWHQCAREEPLRLPSSDIIPSLSNYNQMFALLDFMCLYQHHYLSLLDFTEKYVSLASSLVRTLDFDHSKRPSIRKMKVKVLQVLIHMDTNVLDPGEDDFSKTLDVLLHTSCGDTPLAPEALSILGFILVKYGVLDSTSADITDELGVWIHCCQIADRVDRIEILSFLRNVLVTVATNPSLFIDKIIDSQQEASFKTCSMKHEALVDLAEKIFEELSKVHESTVSSNEMTTDAKQEKKIFFDNINVYEVSSLLMGVLECVASENIMPSVQKYLSYVLIHLLHMQVDPRPFLSVTKRWASMPEGVEKYIYSWLNEQPVPLGNPFGKYSPECSLSRLFLQPNRAVPELEDCNHPISVLLIARLVVFHMVQLAERQELTETIVEGSSDVIVSLFEALLRINENENVVFSKKTQFKFLSLVFKHPGLVNYFSPLVKNKNCSEDFVTNFLLTVLRSVNKYPEILKNTSLTELLRKKFYKSIVYYVDRHTMDFESNLLLTAIECLHLSNNEMHSLINKLKIHMLKNPWNELFLYLVEHVDILHNHMCEIGERLDYFLRTETDPNTGWVMCDTLSRYIEKFPSTANFLPVELFQVAICEEGLNLAVVLHRHRRDCKKIFKESLKEANNKFLQCPKVLFRLLDDCCHDEFPGDKVINIVYRHFEDDILKAMQLPLSIPDNMAENSSSIKNVVQSGIGLQSCRDLSDSLDKNCRNLGLCLPFHLSVIHGLIEKGAWKEKPSSLVKLLLHQLILMVKEEAPCANITQLCTIIVEVLTNNENQWGSMLEPDESWAEIPGLFLKIALKELEGREENLSLSILSVLNNLLWKSKCVKIAKLVFQMTTSHSRFLDIVLKNEIAGVKLAVLQLVLICYQIAPKVMKSVHIPVWLGAYSASLSHCDQLILKILHCMHGSKEINLNAYRPFLWGEAAINHYSIRASAGVSLWRVPPGTAAVELLNMEMVERTIAKFPVNRKLFIEKDISESNEINNNWRSESLESFVPEVYDPAFILPLFSHLMGPENVVDDYKFCRLGGLALTLVCLSSRCKFTRAAALCVISRFHSHLDSNSRFAKMYDHFLEIIRGGLKDLKDRKNRYRKRRRVPEEEYQTEAPNIIDSVNSKDIPMIWMSRVPTFTASFLAKSSLVILNPLKTMFGALHRFFRAKPVMDLFTIPELLEFIRNSSLEFRTYQQWLLETVLAGMKTSEDALIAKKRYFFTMILCLFSSSTSEPPTKVLILQILEAAMKIEFGIRFHDRGLVPWLYASCTQVHEANNGRLTVAFVRLLVTASAKVTLPISKTLPLIFNLPSGVDCDDLLPILQLVHISCSHLSKEHLVIILRLCYKVLDPDVIENCARELMILPSDITSNIQESGESEDTTKESFNTVNKDLLYKELRNIINAYLLKEEIVMNV